MLGDFVQAVDGRPKFRRLLVDLADDDVGRERRLIGAVERQFRRLLLGSCDALPKPLNKLDSIQILPTGSKSTRTSRPYCFP